jgi:hypothetical protein
MCSVAVTVENGLVQTTFESVAPGAFEDSVAPHRFVPVIVSETDVVRAPAPGVMLLIVGGRLGQTTRVAGFWNVTHALLREFLAAVKI